MMVETTEHRRASGTHLSFLDGLRGLCALVVLIDHAWLQVWPVFNYGHAPTGVTAVVTGWLPYGARFAVATFILLSGFCLMLPVARKGGTLRGGVREFFYKRAKRILPPFYAAVAVSLLLIWLLIGRKTGTHWDVSIPVTSRGLLFNLLLLQDMYGKPQINHVFWSIAVEWKIYFLFPVLLAGWRRWGGLATTLGTIAAAFAVFFATRRTVLAGATVYYIGLFVLGMAGAAAASNPASSLGRFATRRSGIVLSLALGVLTVWLCFWNGGYSRAGGGRAGTPQPILDLLACVALLPLLIRGAVTTTNPVIHFLNLRPLVFVGTFAYSLYLIHAPLLQVVWQYAITPLGLSGVPAFIALLGVGIPGILTAAYLFFVLFERPFLNRVPARAAPTGGSTNASLMIDPSRRDERVPSIGADPDRAYNV